MDENGTQGRERELAQDRYRFRRHALIYVLVNLGLVLTWWNTGMGHFWPGYPLLFWGIGLFAHYRGAYRSTGDAWIDQETERILREREGSSHVR
jgi:hypothetical protein